MSLTAIKSKLKKCADSDRANHSQRYFKTGKGEYGEGDIFIGVAVPIVRKLSREYYKVLPIKDVTTLIKSSIHEERLLALFIIVLQFNKTQDNSLKEKIYQLYLRSTRYINNWDLVDCSAGRIVGAFLIFKNKEPIYQLAKSKNLWERRVAIMSTSYFINEGKFNDTLKIAKSYLNDEHDLIHKATGWMLREIGKRDFAVEEQFLKSHYKKMPRVMLRYAIEKFPEDQRKGYLRGEI
ncbi:MAG: DNA alkylation repair protein [Bdellovibrionales bacterium]|jgi:3-methyladenine DNA glycosylase AlkD|nr:DNA alkylation repair protein [Bdellovibrionales bacterium]MBT3527301.1 DNA alkylation repair protein [Bdellovibrionales bacterium]MBT7668824.1 DNA alkylation repair protein [Bdellovibrionales bacterium]MBT7768026.1 DNA alkylation repair protein [Bdellovibrionales bacterium]